MIANNHQELFLLVKCLQSDFFHLEGDIITFGRNLPGLGVEVIIPRFEAAVFS